MLLELILLTIGFLVLVKGADYFVEGAKNVAINFHVPKILIGLTVVAFGTSAPELAVSIKSILSNNYDIVLGNVIGSNIMNILLILGVSSLVHPLLVKKGSLRREYPITLFLTFLFAILMNESLFTTEIVNNFSRIDGIVLLIFFFIFLYILITKTDSLDEKKENNSLSLFKSLIFTIGGILMIIIGSNMVVKAACEIAEFNGISKKLISLTIVAFGTSLPELVTSVIATIKGEYDIAIGNIVGSNMFNIGIVIGLPVTIFGGINKINFDNIDVFVMLLSIILLFIFSKNDHKISRIEGIIFLIIFVVYYYFVIVSG